MFNIEKILKLLLQKPVTNKICPLTHFIIILTIIRMKVANYIFSHIGRNIRSQEPAPWALFPQGQNTMGNCCPQKTEEQQVLTTSGQRVQAFQGEVSFCRGGMFLLFNQ